MADMAPGLGWVHILFGFDGRIARRHYWAGRIAVTAALYAVILGGAMLVPEEYADLASIPILLIYVPFIWASLALQVKRWHDRGKSGFWVLIALIPIVGPVWSFVELGCMRGDYGVNDWGPDPT